jgi:hypothetical protein
MATIHTGTTLAPSKLELLADWLPQRPWYLDAGAPPALTKAGGFRLDDPAGDVGIEFMLVTDAAGERETTYSVPMTYRAAPLEGADDALIGTSEHGVLGTRWFYDAAHDPVAVDQLLALITAPRRRSTRAGARPSTRPSAVPGCPSTAGWSRRARCGCRTAGRAARPSTSASRTTRRERTASSRWTSSACCQATGTRVSGTSKFPGSASTGNRHGAWWPSSGNPRRRTSTAVIARP